VSRHADTNEQKRLNNTLITFSVLHTYYPLLSQEARIAFRTLLLGNSSARGASLEPRADATSSAHQSAAHHASASHATADQPAAWEGLVHHSGLCADGRFRRNDTYGSTEPGDEATAMGSMLLFLQGIIPDSGSLAIPLIEEAYEDPTGGLVTSHFAMDCRGHLLRIPVWKGSMEFQFGTQMASVDFDKDGIYELTFSTDWNHVTDIERRGSLGGDGLRYVQATELERNGTCP
jgi:hypothetical protein